jgi:hypothetical protein
MKIEFEVGDEVKYPIRLVSAMLKEQLKKSAFRQDRWLLWGKVIAVKETKTPLNTYQTIYFESKEGIMIKDSGVNFFPASQSSETIDNYYQIPLKQLAIRDKF